MMTIDHNSYKIRFESPDQILSMGGPWIANLFINDHFVSGNVIVDNVLIDNSAERLFFIKYHIVQKRLNWPYYFTINYVELGKQAIYEFDRKFDMLFLNSFLNESEIEIFVAFHNQIEENKLLFGIVEEKGFFI